MKQTSFFTALLVSVALCSGASALVLAQRRDHLTQLEADKIREAETPGLRIKLFVAFADDRLKKFQYELAQPSDDRRRGERMNSLLLAYASCVDDATGLIEIAREKQQDIAEGLKEVKTKVPAFLSYLEGLEKDSRFPEAYKETLEDSLDATRELLEEAKKAEKEIAPPPVRRRP